jgi:hypothetical protein
VLAFGANLRAFAAFSQTSLVRHGASRASYVGPPEQNSFFGAPLLIVAGVIVAWLWRRRVAVRALTAVALVAFLLSLGTSVVIGDRTVLHRAPMSLLDKLPLFNDVVPSRFGLALIPVIAILLAFSVCAAASASDARLRYGWMLVLCAALVPIAPTPVLAKRAEPVPAFFATGQWRQYVDGDQSVLSADTSWTGEIIAMDWDNAAGQGYRMAGGYFLGPGEHGQGNYDAPLRPTDNLLGYVARTGTDQRITKVQRAAFLTDLRYWHTAIVVLSPDVPHHDQLKNALNQLTGEQARQVPGALLWDVRALSG